MSSLNQLHITPVRCFHPGGLCPDAEPLQSKPPQSEDEFRSASEFILGHFTSSVFLDSILKYGLIPDVDGSRAIEDGLRSDSESVYLATRIDRLYLKRAIQHHNGKGIAVEVQVPRSALLADENYLAPSELERISPETALYLSMCSGACKHRGPIPQAQILSITDCHGLSMYKK